MIEQYISSEWMQGLFAGLAGLITAYFTARYTKKTAPPIASTPEPVSSPEASAEMRLALAAERLAVIAEKMERNFDFYMRLKDREK
jgi:hypothetical protein